MAARPVDWMVDIMVEGGVVLVVVSMAWGIENVLEVIPKQQHSQYSVEVNALGVRMGFTRELI